MELRNLMKKIIVQLLIVGIILTGIPTMAFAEDAGADQSEASLTITSPEEGEMVYPYTEQVKSYLTTEDADISRYCGSGSTDRAAADVTIAWGWGDEDGADSETPDEETDSDYIGDDVTYVNLADCLASETGTITLSKNGTSSVTSDLAVGYGKTVRIDMQSYNENMGGIYVLIGSYGFHLRGGQFRTAVMPENGTYSEENRTTGMSCDNTFFHEEGAYVELKVSMENNLPVMHIRAVSDTMTKEYTYTFPTRISGEIDSKKAKVTIGLVEGKADGIEKLEVKTGVKTEADNGNTDSGDNNTEDGNEDGNTEENNLNYVVEYATKADYSDAITVETTEESVGLRNLYKATKYYVRVTAYEDDVQVGQDESTFETTSVGPRIMTVDSLFNVRDLGGYETSYGKTTKQGLIFRGSEMDGPHNIAISEAGEAYMSDVLGIAHDMDLRAYDSSYTEGSPISSAYKVYYGIGGYTSAFSSGSAESYRKIFSALANEKNYPVYIHCWGGADRTGTICYLINALCGVSEEELIQDYEMTSFSIFGVRAENSTSYAFAEFVETLKTYEGDTLAEKTETFLKSIGVTQTEINNIRAIMFGEEPEVTVSAPATFDAYTDTEFEVSVSTDKEIETVTLNGTAFDFETSERGFKLNVEDLKRLENGTVEGMITFADGTTAEFGFENDSVPVVNLTDYMKSENGTVTLNSSNVTAASNLAIGYGTRVRIDMQSSGVTDSGIYALIGSYGFYLRGGEFRPAVMEETGTYKEYKRSQGMSCSNDFFNQEDAYVILEINIVDDKPVMFIKAVSSTGTREYTYTFGERVTNEIASEDAKVTFGLNTAGIEQLVIKTGITESSGGSGDTDDSGNTGDSDNTGSSGNTGGSDNTGDTGNSSGGSSSGGSSTPSTSIVVKPSDKTENDKDETVENTDKDESDELVDALKNTRFKVRSKKTNLNGKRAIKLTWSVPEGIDFDGYEIFRSTRRYSGYGKEPIFTTTKTTYINNKELVKGTKYYYKGRGYKYVNGEKVYSQWSWKAWRIA